LIAASIAYKSMSKASVRFCPTGHIQVDCDTVSDDVYENCLLSNSCTPCPAKASCNANGTLVCPAGTVVESVNGMQACVEDDAIKDVASKVAANLKHFLEGKRGDAECGGTEGYTMSHEELRRLVTKQHLELHGAEPDTEREAINSNRTAEATAHADIVLKKFESIRSQFEIQKLGENYFTETSRVPIACLAKRLLWRYAIEIFLAVTIPGLLLIWVRRCLANREV
jgi:hypothetical protein